MEEKCARKEYSIHPPALTQVVGFVLYNGVVHAQV